ncbi:hypothetical protein HK098_004499 [Nowakowskiella sp. JEL0407]|nr:hypothetical protein HK098_004499 [Nowakowskiella sp. JEL0407]
MCVTYFIRDLNEFVHVISTESKSTLDQISNSIQHPSGTPMEDFNPAVFGLPPEISISSDEPLDISASAMNSNLFKSFHIPDSLNKALHTPIPDLLNTEILNSSIPELPSVKQYTNYASNLLNSSISYFSSAIEIEEKKKSKEVFLDRKSLELLKLRCDAKTYLWENDGVGDFSMWVEGFELKDHEEEVKLFLEDDNTLKVYNKLVPSHLTNEVFWSRYYYKAMKFESEIEARKALINQALGAKDTEEVIDWGSDDEDNDVVNAKETTEHNESEESVELEKSVENEVETNPTEPSTGSAKVQRNSEDSKQSDGETDTSYDLVSVPSAVNTPIMTGTKAKVDPPEVKKEGSDAEDWGDDWD